MIQSQYLSLSCIRCYKARYGREPPDFLTHQYGVCDYCGKKGIVVSQ